MNPTYAAKKIAFMTAILATVNVASQAEVKFLIKQVQHGADGQNGLETTPVYSLDDGLLTEDQESSGDHPAQLTIGEYGSSFYLYVQGLNDPDGPPVLLDEKFIGQYVARAELEITSADPHYPTRTRADQPYTVTVKSWNQNWANATNPPQLDWNPLSMGLSASYIYEGSTESHEIDLDPTDDSSLLEGLPITLGMTTTGTSDTSPHTKTLTIPSASIEPESTSASSEQFPYEELSTVRGKETYKIWAESGRDANDNTIMKTVAQKSIQIWPLTQAAILDPGAVITDGKINITDGTPIAPLVDGQKITRSMPNLVVALWDLYPNSTTYVTIYKGDPATIGSTAPVPVYTPRVIKINQDVPQCDLIALSNWDEYITEDGIYTLEVATITPFNNGAPERILAISFEVDRTIKVVGSTTTSE